jgi:hypothetical protein
MLPVGDAGGHDGSDAVSRLTMILWETPEVTTAAMASVVVKFFRTPKSVITQAAWRSY